MMKMKMKKPEEKCIERYMDDFELWCEECVTIYDKLTGQTVPLRLNAPQRRVAMIMETQRRLGRPIRILLLKARQWGGSTLVQAYMAWMQLVRHTCWNSLVCAHYKEAAAVIRGTYSRLLRNYPKELKEGPAKEWQLQSYEKTQGISYLPARDCRLAIATALRPDALRSGSFHMAHLSEAAFWADGKEEAASAIVRTVGGCVPLEPETLVVVESTANGTDNYMYHEWQRAQRGESDKIPVFVPWYEIEIYREELSDKERDELLGTLNDYERGLFDIGVSAESIAWYRKKSREYATPQEMMAEFPSTPEEAFATTQKPTFSEADVECLVSVNPTSRATHPLLVVCGATVALFVIRDGVICCEKSAEAADMLLLMRKVREWSACYNATTVVGDIPDEEGVSHGRWCLRYLQSRNLPLSYDDDDNAMQDLTPQTIADLVDLHRELMHDGKIARFDNPDSSAPYGITDTFDAADYLGFDPRRAYRYPVLLASLVATHYLEPILRQPLLSPDDF
jgi:hypothetical protein